MEPLLETKESFRIRYQCHETAEFGKAFRKLDISAQKMIDKTIQDVLFLQPYESKRLVSPKFSGKRSLRIGNYRIVFAVCKECRALGEVYVNRCENCSKHGLNGIVLFGCGHRKHIYDV